MRLHGCSVTGPRQRLRGAAVAAALLFAASAGTLFGASAARAADRAFLAFGAGVFDVNDDQKSAEFHVEIRTDYDLWIFNPIAGFIVNTDLAAYGYAGLQTDIFFGRRIVLTPSLSVGWYERGDSKDLGHNIEFRSAVELAYRFDNRSRLGIQFYHLSNASLADENPGTEVLAITWARPFGGP
jgi:hypothetical protein